MVVEKKRLARHGSGSTAGSPVRQKLRKMISDGGASGTSYSEAGAEPAVLPLDGSDAESEAEGAAEDEAWKHIADEAAVEVCVCVCVCVCVT